MSSLSFGLCSMYSLFWCKYIVIESISTCSYILIVYFRHQSWTCTLEQFPKATSSWTSTRERCSEVECNDVTTGDFIYFRLLSHEDDSEKVFTQADFDHYA